ncbi:MAG: hypothetical protein IPP94_13495 [Ignavibacteria bacterium]|nr:hypothetical protein [Ignavibacteria bacterium]
MAVRLSDSEIADLIAEEKVLPSDYRQKVKLNPKHGHSERELEMTGVKGNEFALILRQSSYNHLDFSIILTWLPPNSSTRFRLRRYNGKSHEHTNKLESDRFYDFHIHQATERYQQTGLREDSFAEATSRYQDLGSALQCVIQDCGFHIPGNETLDLFNQGGAS